MHLRVARLVQLYPDPRFWNLPPVAASFGRHLCALKTESDLRIALTIPIEESNDLDAKPLAATEKAVGGLSWRSSSFCNVNHIIFVVLTVMVVEALTDCRPFIGRTAADLIAAILKAPFHLPDEECEIEQLDRVLQRCRAKDREQRFPSVAAMQQELIPVIDHCPALYTRRGVD